MTTHFAKPAEAYLLRLYVAGQTPKCITAFVNLKKICEEHLAEKWRCPELSCRFESVIMGIMLPS